MFRSSQMATSVTPGTALARSIRTSRKVSTAAARSAGWAPATDCWNQMLITFLRSKPRSTPVMTMYVVTTKAVPTRSNATNATSATRNADSARVARRPAEIGPPPDFMSDSKSTREVRQAGAVENSSPHDAATTTTVVSTRALTAMPSARVSPSGSIALAIWTPAMDSATAITADDSDSSTPSTSRVITS